MNRQGVRQLLYIIEEMAGKSQGLWDNAWTNAVIADHPDKNTWTQQTYQATRLHSDCMDILRGLLDSLNEDEMREAHERDAKTFATEIALGHIKWMPHSNN